MSTLLYYTSLLLVLLNLHAHQGQAQPPPSAYQLDWYAHFEAPEGITTQPKQLYTANGAHYVWGDFKSTASPSTTCKDAIFYHHYNKREHKTPLDIGFCQGTFIQKLDNKGQVLWWRAWDLGQPSGCSLSVQQLVVDKQERVYIAGWLQGACDLDDSSNKAILDKDSIHKERFFIMQLDATGHRNWVRTYKDWQGTAADSCFLGLSPNQEQLVVALGKGRVYSLDTKGDVLWTHQFHNPNFEEEVVKQLAIGLEGNIYLALHVRQRGYSPETNIYWAVWEALDKQGHTIWSKMELQPSFEGQLGLCLDEKGQVYTWAAIIIYPSYGLDMPSPIDPPNQENTLLPYTQVQIEYLTPAQRFKKFLLYCDYFQQTLDFQIINNQFYVLSYQDAVPKNIKNYGSSTKPLNALPSRTLRVFDKQGMPLWQYELDVKALEKQEQFIKMAYDHCNNKLIGLGWLASKTSLDPSKKSKSIPSNERVLWQWSLPKQ